MFGECDRCGSTSHEINDQSECLLCRSEDLIIADTRESYPDMSEQDALSHVLDTIAVDDVDGDDELAEAYRYVIRHWVG